MRIVIWLSIIFLFKGMAYAEPIPYPAADTLALHTEAIQILKKHYKQAKNDSLKVVVLHKIAFRYLRLEKYDSALIHINTALGLIKNQKSFALPLSYLYRYKGAAHYYLYNRKEAIKWFEKSNDICNANKFYLEEMQICSNLGAMYIEENDLAKAEIFLKRNIALSKQYNFLTDDKALMGRRLLATLYQKMKKYDAAKKIFEDLIADCRKEKNNLILVSALTYYATYLGETKQFSHAEKIFYEAIQYQKEDSSANSHAAIYAEMAKMYEDAGQYLKANNCKDSAYQLKIEEFKAQTQQEIAESEAKYNNYVLSSNLEMANKKRVIQLAIFIVMALLGLLAWLGYYYTQRKKQALLKEQRNKAVLEAVIEGEEKERMRLARELHDGIVQEITILGREINNLNNEDIATKKTAVGTKIKNLVDEVRLISHSLMPHALTTLGLEPALKDLFRKNFEYSDIEYSIDVKGNRIPIAQKIEITFYRITQELINNIIKHSRATEVHAQLIFKEHALVLIIEDDGVGMGAASSVGIGLANIESRLSLINGDFEYDGSNGTVTIIRVPL